MQYILIHMKKLYITNSLAGIVVGVYCFCLITFMVVIFWDYLHFKHSMVFGLLRIY